MSVDFDRPEHPTEMRYAGSELAEWEARQHALEYLALAAEFLQLATRGSRWPDDAVALVLNEAFSDYEWRFKAEEGGAS